MRYDNVETPDAPRENPKFVARNGFSNAQRFDMSVVQPRIGFNYDASESLLVMLIESSVLKSEVDMDSSWVVFQCLVWKCIQSFWRSF
ncbi:MAG: hypothetical protein Ct9H90mP13_11640 [Pseudomonadota bacterium]|nr:MAG: hypothetical protein Ct9H90mP13_11640 [Pseudomonadota bacterium]